MHCFYYLNFGFTNFHLFSPVCLCVSNSLSVCRSPQALVLDFFTIFIQELLPKLMVTTPYVVLSPPLFCGPNPHRLEFKKTTHRMAPSTLHIFHTRRHSDIQHITYNMHLHYTYILIYRYVYVPMTIELASISKRAKLLAPICKCFIYNGSLYKNSIT